MSAVVPAENAREAAFVSGIEVVAAQSLRSVVRHLSGEGPLAPVAPADIEGMLGGITTGGEDFAYIRGQYQAKRAAEIAVAGGHNMLMIGPPGTGKTMIARAIPTILPKMTVAEALETTKIHSIAGILDREDGVICRRPFRTPHHTTTAIALIGGGGKAMPGEISYAHNGVLFLDEMPEYHRNTLEALRQPLEDGFMSVSRILRSVQYPSKFMLVAGMNPCPCGNFGSATLDCRCSPAQIHKYFSRVSGPLLDRIDIQVEVDSVKYEEMTAASLSESSETIKRRVDAARGIQLERFADAGLYCNARMPQPMLEKYCALDSESARVMKTAFDKLGMSARMYSRILRVARTIADLAGEPNIGSSHIYEAIQYRCLDRKYRI